MDVAVLRSLARWPNVPACFGWLVLDRQGHWRLQSEVVTHRGFADFIGRNYQHDTAGRWFFQNGAQRVYVELAYTPWVFGFEENTPSQLISHTGIAANPHTAWIDESGILLVDTDVGIGIVASQDLVRLSDALALDETLTHGTLSLGTHRLVVSPIKANEVAGRFGFDPSPRPETTSN